MITLKNQYLAVDLHPKGAEIHRIIGQKDQMNYMWKRDASLWANSAPILFPIVGALRNDTCVIEGKEYHMTQHGFARHQEFDTEKEGDTKVTFTLRSNPEIARQYPYLFALRVIYTLEESSLVCHLEVENEDDKPIVFSLGGHPAFACPFYENESSNDYYLEFSQNETLERKIIDVEKRGMSRKTEPFLDNERRFFVRQAMFDRDAIVVKNFQSESVALRSLNHDKAIIFHMENFEHLGLWASKHVGGLIAIEPWIGHADYVDFTGSFAEKECIRTLPVHEVFKACFKIEIAQ